MQYLRETRIGHVTDLEISMRKDTSDITITSWYRNCTAGLTVPKGHTLRVASKIAMIVAEAQSGPCGACRVVSCKSTSQIRASRRLSRRASRGYKTSILLYVLRKIAHSNTKKKYVFLR